MGKGKRYSDEFKRAAVARVIGGESVDAVARECGASGHSIREWVKGAASASRARPVTAAELEEIRQLKRELRRVKEDNDILKKATLESMVRRNTSRLERCTCRRPCKNKEETTQTLTALNYGAAGNLVTASVT